MSDAQESSSLARSGWFPLLGLDPLEFRDPEAEAAYGRLTARQSLQTDHLHFAGGAALHVLVSFALYRAEAFPMATLILAVAGYMAASSALVVRRPESYLRWRQALYMSQCVLAMLEAKWLIEYFFLSISSPSGGLLVWIPSLLVNSAMPWQVLHALVYPMPLRHAVLVHGVAAAVLLSSNPLRCSVTLASCPVSGAKLAELATFMTSASSLFFASKRGGATDAGDPAHQYRACLSTYAVAQVVVGYLAAMRMAWCQDRWARLQYLRRLEVEEAVELEWQLERLQPSLLVTALELALAAGLLWASIQLYFQLFP